MRDHGQYHAIAAATVFFYDFLLTLADEVSHVVSVTLCRVRYPSCERSNMLGTGGNHGVRRERLLVVHYSLTM